MEYLKEQYLKEKSSETTWTLVDDMETEEYQHTAEAEDKEPDQSHDDLESVLWPVSREDAILLEQLVGPLPELDKYLRPEVF